MEAWNLVGLQMDPQGQVELRDNLFILAAWALIILTDQQIGSSANAFFSE